MNEEKKKKNRPERTFSAGPISLAVWTNETSTGPEEPSREFRTVTFERRYKDAEDKWQNTTQLRERDLLPAAFLMKKAYDYILSHSKGATEDSDE